MRFRVLLLCVLLSASLANDVSAQPAQLTRATVASERVNVRQDPDVESPIVTTFSRGAVVEVLERRESWTRIRSGAHSGWMRTSLLDLTGAVVRSSSTSSDVLPPVNTGTGSGAVGGDRASVGTISSAASPPTSSTVASVRERVATSRRIDIGYTDVGVVVGLASGVYGSEFGGRFTRAIRTVPELRNGAISLGVGASRATFSDAVQTTTLMPITATANYHYPFADERYDAFLGGGIGYFLLSCSVNRPATVFAQVCNARSSIGLVTRLGGRYFFTDRTAAYADAGLGGAALNLGVIVRVR